MEYICADKLANNSGENFYRLKALMGERLQEGGIYTGRFIESKIVDQLKVYFRIVK